MMFYVIWFFLAGVHIGQNDCLVVDAFFFVDAKTLRLKDFFLFFARLAIYLFLGVVAELLSQG